MGRRKKEEQPVEIEILEKPANSFCVGCKNTNIRLVKDTLNLLFLTLNSFADYLGVEGDVKKKCKEISKWVRSQREKDEAIQRKVSGKSKTKG